MSHQYRFAASDLHDTNMPLEMKVKHNHMILQSVKTELNVCKHFGDTANRE